MVVQTNATITRSACISTMAYFPLKERQRLELFDLSTTTCNDFVAELYSDEFVSHNMQTLIDDLAVSGMGTGFKYFDCRRICRSKNGGLD